MKRLVVSLILIGSFVGALWAGWKLRAGNSSPIDLDLIWIRIPNVEMWWVILLSITFGASLATLVVGFAWTRGRLLNHRYKRAIKKLEAELHEMRSLPLAGSRTAEQEDLSPSHSSTEPV